MLEAVIEAGGENVESDPEQHVVTSAPDDFNSVRDALEQRLGPANSARLAWRPRTSAAIDEETATSLFKLLETLEDSDDVQNVYANSRWRRTSWLGSTPERGQDRNGGRGMRVMGLDPGLRHTGWGVIDVAGNRLSHVADGVIHARADQPLANRLVSLFRQINAVLETYRPDEAAVEESFVNKNPASTLKLGVARGVVLLAPAERGLPVSEYSANLVKKSVVGAGHAEKAQVALMVRRLLPGCGLDGADAADALAVAICHAHHAETRRLWRAS